MDDRDVSTFFEPCRCDDRFSIEPHGDAYALFYGRCPHKHGYNFMRISEVSFNAPDMKEIENALNSHPQLVSRLN
jgi:hypothetical protein